MSDLKTFQAFTYAELERARPAEGTPRIAEQPTPYAVICPEHDQVHLTDDEYMRQLCRPDSLWMCPKCGDVAQFDDDNYEAHLDAAETP